VVVVVVVVGSLVAMQGMSSIRTRWLVFLVELYSRKLE